MSTRRFFAAAFFRRRAGTPPVVRIPLQRRFLRFCVFLHAAYCFHYRQDERQRHFRATADAALFCVIDTIIDG